MAARATGVSRKVDDLGRIVLPAELRRSFDIREGDHVEIAVEDWAAWDVSYVGVVPAARRRGVGAELVVKALWEAKAAGILQVSLAVDARNEPARRLYRRLGFETGEQFLAELERHTSRVRELFVRLSARERR